MTSRLITEMLSDMVQWLVLTAHLIDSRITLEMGLWVCVVSWEM